MKSALEAAEPHPGHIVHRQFEEKDYLPWDVVDHGFRDTFLWWDYQRAYSSRHTPVCDTATCKLCGVC
ncbi:MAG: hypothetical protein ACE5ER_04375 [Nitrospinaceae bacterium]